MEAIKRFLSSLSELVLCSLQFSESREVFEILQSTFEKILHTQVKRLYLGWNEKKTLSLPIFQGEEKGAQLLEMISDNSDISGKEKAFQQLIVSNNDSYEFSYAGMKKILLANLHCYLSMMYPLLHRHLFQSNDSKTRDKLKLRMWNKWKK